MSGRTRNYISPSVCKLLNGIQIALVAVDLKDGQIIFANTVAEDLTCHQAQSLKKTTFSQYFDLKSQKKIAAVLDIFREQTESSQLQEFNLSLFKANKKPLTVNITANLWKSTNKSLVLFCIQDLSETIRLQQQREADLKEFSHLSKLADIGRLAAGVAHELNNPLMIIQGFAENLDLLSQEENISLNELKMELGEILKATDRMAKIISQMTRFVRNDDFQTLDIDPQELINNVIQLFKANLANNEIELSLEIEPACTINCDPNQIEQILVNILNNAVHALSEKNMNRLIKISCHRQGGKTILSVWNNGPEIPVDIRDKIMSPFFTTKEVGSGTGLGLALSFGIMKAHQGDLRFLSSPMGTEFFLVFPLTESKRHIKNKHHSKVLVVDDDPVACEVLSNKLKIFGYSVFSAHEAAQALQTLKSHPDTVAVFTDLRMPHMDGQALTKAIRSTPQGKSILIFGVSGYLPSRSVEMQMRRAGINDFISKPIDLNIFSKIVRRIESHITEQAKAKKSTAA